MLQADDVETGMIVTIHSWKPRVCIVQAGEAFFQVERENHAWEGIPLRVKAVALPYMSCKILASPDPALQPDLIVDLRRARLMRLTDGFGPTPTGAAEHTAEGGCATQGRPWWRFWR